MYYEINVSFKGIHLFATSKRSITTEAQMKAVGAVLMEKFPESEGYEMHIIQWHHEGTVINLAR